jgi:transposase
MEHTTIAVDLAKSVFQVAVSHRPGHLDEERRLSRARLLPFFAQRPPATIVFEACGSAHYWARQFQPFGHTVRLLPAHDVPPYVRGNSTNANWLRLNLISSADLRSSSSRERLQERQRSTQASRPLSLPV